MRKWFFFLSSAQLCDWLEYVIIELDYRNIVTIDNLIFLSLFFLGSLEWISSQNGQRSCWKTTQIRKKCLRHYMLQIVMQLLTDFCSISRCHFNVFSTYLPNSLPFTMAWKPFWSRISMLIRFHKIFFLCLIVYSTR